MKLETIVKVEQENPPQDAIVKDAIQDPQRICELYNVEILFFRPKDN